MTRFSTESPWWVVLGVERSSLLALIKQNYYLLSEKYHPDKATGDAEVMKIINNAWDKAKQEKTENRGYANTEDYSGNNYHQHQEKDKGVDHRQYRHLDIQKIEDTEYWDTSLAYPQNWKNLLSNFLWLPDGHIQFPVLAAIGLIPSVMASRNLPIVFPVGNPGTGKSRILELLSYVHKVDIMLANSTYASIRNKITIRKYGSKGGKGREQNTVLLFDNVLEETLDDDNLYNMFLGAYDRKTSNISIASTGEDGDYNFDVFGLTVISSVIDLNRLAKYSELQRRMLPIYTANAPSIEIASQIEQTDDYDFTALHTGFTALWNDETMCKHYCEVRQKVRKALKHDARFTIKQHPLILEIITTGVTCQIWDSVTSAVNNLYEQLQLAVSHVRESPLEIAIAEILANHAKTYYGGSKSEKISTSEVAEILNQQVRNRLIESREVSPKEITRIMASHGYKLKNGNWKLAQ
jgi:hypothetical protein